MALKGSLTEASLPDVIQLLSLSLKAGCLSVTDGKNFGNIFIKDGKIIYATLLNRAEQFGDILVRKQLITREQLEQALAIQKNNKQKRLGQIMVEMAAITPEILTQQLKEQIAETIFVMLTWEYGYFNFEANLLPKAEEFTVQLSPQEILLEAARRIDEWRKIENKLPPFETILVPTGNLADLPLTSQEQNIIRLIDGSRSIDEIVKLSAYDFFETCRTIYCFISAGLLGKSQEPLVSQKKVGRDVSEYRNLGFAFYKTEMFDEAEREFRKMLEIDKDNTEARLYCALIEIRRGHYESARVLLVQANSLEKRLSLLINLGYVCNKLGLYEEALNYLNQAHKLSPDDPKVNCNLGIVYWNHGDLENAWQTFSQLLEKSPNLLTPYIYLPIICIKKGDAQGAIGFLKMAIERFPRFAAFKNNYAVLYEYIDKPEEAEKFYRLALEERPEDLKICSNLADFYYEAQILGAAKELYERIPEEKRDWQILFKLGNIYLRLGDEDSALNFWKKAQGLRPGEQIIAKNIEILQKSRGK